jgi:hypothetical protein
VVEAFEVLEVPAKSSSSFPNGFIGPAGRQESRIQKINIFWIPACAGMTKGTGNDGKGLDFRFPLPASARRTGG